MKRDAKNWTLRLFTLVVVTACFVVMGSSLMLRQNFKSLLTLWGEDVQMTVYLAQDLSDQGRAEIEKKLKDNQNVGTVQLVSQEKALGDFRVQLASYAPDLSQDDELLKLIPASFQVKLANDIATEQQTRVLQSLAAEFRILEGVDEVSYGQDWVEKYAALVSAIETALELLSVIVVLASLFVISNAVRASIQNRKEEIVVLEMIGATSAMIRWPFIKEGALLGFGSSVVALILCFGFFAAIKHLAITKLSFLQLGDHLQFIAPGVGVVFIFAGTLLGAGASYLCVRQINDGYAGIQG